ncbi:MAG: 4'-phosphopantetheinyl transferase superfamily protein [Lachnospiraceae bacterium]|nr:4'-phosphopantetheinyl transferase superfamily protein [Lachnospiraceae bacterium]
MKIYLLSIEELQEGIVSEEECLQKLDSHRREKAERTRAQGARYLSIGAGLLLQLAGCKHDPEMDLAGDATTMADSGQVQVEIRSVTQLLEQLMSFACPREFTYVYSAKGKPQFADNLGGTDGFPFFNLSHSGHYVCCAVASEPVGIDIQQMRPLNSLRVAERYFSEREKQALEACADSRTRQELFYRVWVKKEACAKLTGEGISAEIRVDTMTVSNAETAAGAAMSGREIIWSETQAPLGYCMAVCRYRESIQ